MTTQTEQTTAPVTEDQGSHHFLITLQKQQPNGSVTNLTINSDITPLEGFTRADLYKDIYAHYSNGEYAHMAGAAVLFFALEPNQL